MAEQQLSEILAFIIVLIMGTPKMVHLILGNTNI